MSLRFTLASLALVGCAPSEWTEPAAPDTAGEEADPGLAPRGVVGDVPSLEGPDSGEPAEVPPDADMDGSIDDEDCDDADPYVFPGAPELCDGVQNDCDTAWSADMEAGSVSMETKSGSWMNLTYVANGVGSAPDQPAVLQVPHGSTLWLCDGSYYARLLVSGTASVVGRNGADSVSIGGKGGSVVTVYPGADLTIDGVTLTNGTGTIGSDGVSRGGAIFGESGDVTLVDARVVANYAGEGGGAWLGWGSITSKATDWGKAGWDNDPEDVVVAGVAVRQAPEDFDCSTTSCEVEDDVD
jgi:hypothetical protein